MIYANYHTHTERCRHAEGNDREYVETAIEMGVRELGFSDHSPMLFSNKDHYSTFRMRPEQTEEYVRSVRTLQKEYEKDIKILLGFEMEYYPAYFEKTIEFLKTFDYDYLLLGQHFAGNEPCAAYSGHSTQSIDILKDYVDLVIEGMESGEYLYIAHPDIINYQGDIEIYREQMHRICRYAKENDIPIEFNQLGYETHRNYPNKEFLRLCAEVGNTLIIGVDAHTPNAFRSQELEYVSEQLSRLEEIKVIDRIDSSKFRNY